MITRYMQEMEEKRSLVDGLVEKANSEARDLDEKEMELVTRSRDRIKQIDGQLDPLVEARRIHVDSEERIATLAEFVGEHERPAQKIEYRSAGQYILDRWKAGIGSEDAGRRIELYHRAAAHQTTGDNPGLLPQQIIGEVINFVDQSRPLVTAVGPRALPAGAWSRPKISQHTNVAPQSGRENRAGQPQDDHRDGAGDRPDVRRLRQRVQAEHRLVTAGGDGPDRQRPGRRVRPGDRKGVLLPRSTRPPRPGRRCRRAPRPRPR